MQDIMLFALTHIPMKGKFSEEKSAPRCDPNLDYSEDTAVRVEGLSHQYMFWGEKFICKSSGMCCTKGKVQIPGLQPPLEPLFN